MIEGRKLKHRSKVWWAQLLNRQIQFSMDLIVLVAAFVLVYLLRFDFGIPRENLLQGLRQLPYVVLFQFGALVLAGVYTFIWRYIGMAEVRAFINAAYWAFLPIVFIRLCLPSSYHQWRVPVSVIFIDTILAFGGVLGLRVIRRS